MAEAQTMPTVAMARMPRCEKCIGLNRRERSSDSLNDIAIVSVRQKIFKSDLGVCKLPETASTPSELADEDEAGAMCRLMSRLVCIDWDAINLNAWTGTHSLRQQVLL